MVKGMVSGPSLSRCVYVAPDLVAGDRPLDKRVCRPSSVTATSERENLRTTESCLGQYHTARSDDNVKLEKQKDIMLQNNSDEMAVEAGMYPVTRAWQSSET